MTTDERTGSPEWESVVTEVVYALDGDYVGFLQLKQGTTVVAAGGSPAGRQVKSFRLDPGDFIIEVSGRQASVLDFVKFVTARNVTYPVGLSTGGDAFCHRAEPGHALYSANLATTKWKSHCNSMFVKFLDSVMDTFVQPQSPPGHPTSTGTGTPPSPGTITTTTTTSTHLSSVDGGMDILVFSDLHLGSFPPRKSMGNQCPTQVVDHLCDGLVSWFERKTTGNPPAASPTHLAVVMAGDIFDLWAQPIDILFKSLSDIDSFDPSRWLEAPHLSDQTRLYLQYLVANPKVFDLRAACLTFKETIRKLKSAGVNFYYLTGNHDMTVTPEDITSFFSGDVEYTDGTFFSDSNQTVIVEHGHSKDIFDMRLSPPNPIVYGVLPFGFFTTKLRTTVDIREESTGKRKKLVHKIVKKFGTAQAREVLSLPHHPEIRKIPCDICEWHALLEIVLAVAYKSTQYESICLEIPLSSTETTTASLPAVIEKYEKIMHALYLGARLESLKSQPQTETVLDGDTAHKKFDLILSTTPELSPLILSKTVDQYAWQLLNASENTACVVLGHTHCAMTREFAPKKLYINSGTTKRLTKAALIEITCNTTTKEVLHYRSYFLPNST
ncbi:hypothetical protein Pelo_16518 [Pelomyxa schiedti]|nr:hypothetical protein Pelo_16518 [Pelomyxa schiedti]